MLARELGYTCDQCYICTECLSKVYSYQLKVLINGAANNIMSLAKTNCRLQSILHITHWPQLGKGVFGEAISIGQLLLTLSVLKLIVTAAAPPFTQSLSTFRMSSQLPLVSIFTLNSTAELGVGCYLVHGMCAQNNLAEIWKHLACNTNNYFVGWKYL